MKLENPVVEGTDPRNAQLLQPVLRQLDAKSPCGIMQLTV
jgi:hypothetical protein